MTSIKPLKHCSVVSCASKYEPGITYHRFPNEPSRRREWLKALGWKGTQLTERSAICSKHFRSKDYYPGLSRIYLHSVPSLKLHRTLPKDKGKSKPQKKEQPKKVSEKQYSVKKISCKPHSGTKSTVLNARTVLFDKNGLDSPRKWFKKPPTANQRKKMAAGRQFGTKALPARLASNGRRTGSFSKSNKKGTPRTKPMNKPKEDDQKDVLSNYSNSPEFAGFLSGIASPKSTNSSPSNLPKTDYKNIGKTHDENSENPDDENSESPDDENVEKTDDESAVSTNDKNADETDDEKINDESVVNTDNENVDKTDDENIDVNDDKTDSENIENVKKENNENFDEPFDKNMAKTNKEMCVITCNKVNYENNLEKSDEEYAVKSQSITLRKSFEEKSTNSVNKRQRFKRKRLISTSSQDSSEETNERKSLDKKSNSTEHTRTSRNVRRDSRKRRKPSRTIERVNCNLYDIEGVIAEMQNKIKNLERKSILDEKKIETFKKALIEQRENDIKMLMDEKENELLLRMDLLYLDYDPQRICRLCLLLIDRKESLTPLFRPFKSESLIPLIKSATGVEIEPEEGMPNGICDNCLQQMKRIDWIKRRTQKTNDLISKFVTRKKSMAEISHFSPSPMINMYDDTLQEELSDTFKIENVFSLEATTYEMEFVKEEILSDEEDIKPSCFEDLSVVKLERKPVRKMKKCKKCSTLFTNHWSFREHVKYCNNRFQCSECRKRFWNSYLLKCHKRRRHSCMSEWSLRYCQECEIPFRWKHQLLFHIIRHTPVSCELCGGEYHCVDRLRRHLSESHYRS